MFRESATSSSLSTARDDNARSVYQYRLAKLYYENNNKSGCEKQLSLAAANTSSEQARQKIKRILNGAWNEL